MVADGSVTYLCMTAARHFFIFLAYLVYLGDKVYIEHIKSLKRGGFS